MSQWRRDAAQCPGGFMMDSAVHLTAGIRILALATGATYPLVARAHTLSTTDALPAPDTAAGTVTWDNGLVTTCSITFASHTVRGFHDLHVGNRLCVARVFLSWFGVKGTSIYVKQNAALVAVATCAGLDGTSTSLCVALLTCTILDRLRQMAAAGCTDLIDCRTAL